LKRGEGLTARLASHALDYHANRFSPRAIAVAKLCVLDWFGVTLAGTREPCASILHAAIEPNPSAKCSVIGSSERFSAHDAALINGTMSHALDYDDVNTSMSGHPTVAILPAVLALAERQRKTGAQLLTAFIAGHEVAAALGHWMAPSHYARGFHATGTIGAIGAAAACGVLLGLDAARLQMALGLAATQASGLKSMFGTMAKPFHAGRAAANGVLAARLAENGFGANAEALDGRQGFIAMLSDEIVSSNRLFPDPGCEIPNTLFKYHAACYLTHSTIEAVRGLCMQHDISAADIAAIVLHVPAGHLDVCNIEEPRDSLEAKFSLRHVACLAATGADTAAIDTFNGPALIDPVLAGLRRRVSVHGDYKPGTGARAIIHLHTGCKFSMEADVGIVETDADAQAAALNRKFNGLAVSVMGEKRAGELAAAIRALEDLDDVRGVMESASPHGRKTKTGG
jgi:2-methylcitrate dehydratase PrpD